MSPARRPSLGETLVDVLRARAEQQGEELLYRFLETGDVEGPSQEWTYAKLDLQARAIGALLQEAGAHGERALLLFPPGMEFISAFMGCLYAGAVAVPAYPPDPARLERTLPRLRAIAQDCRARFVLTTSFILELSEALIPQAPELGELRWVATDAVAETQASAWRPPEIHSGSLTFLQYTSGSTGTPKGVMLSHSHLLHNEELIRRGFGHGSDTVVVGWLPLFHDMGLIGNVLQPLYLGRPCTLMSPISFLQRPLRWLEAVSRFRATTSGGPNFAYDLCARKATPEILERLDLSSWKVAFNGAEPIREETLRRFTETFAPCGFRAGTHYPCYGLAEATLFVTGAIQGQGALWRSVEGGALEKGQARPAAEAAQERVLVSSGRSGEGQQVRIVHPETGAPRASGEIGEIWVSGPSVAQGYWNRPEESARTFSARLPDGSGPFLRTGDLGFLEGEELFVTGRLKDLIIIRGRNLYPQDIELTTERSHPSIRPGCCAAFAVDTEGEERLVVVAEVDPRGEADARAISESVRRAIAEEYQAHAHAVVLVSPRSILKTSSGKIQRHACREAFLAGTLEEVERSVAAEQVLADAEAGPALHEALPLTPAEQRLARVEAFVRGALARLARVSPERISLTASPADLGLDSLMTVELHGRLEAALGTAVPSSLLWENPTLSSVSAALLAHWERARQGSSAAGLSPTPGTLEGQLPVSPGQFRLWFLDRLFPNSALYNVHFGLRMSGALDLGVLKSSLDDLVRRHVILRTVFRDVEGEPRQIVLPAQPVELKQVDLRGLAAGEREEELRRQAVLHGQEPFDLFAGPLVRMALVRLGDEEHVLLVTQHHTITDGWSISVLARELAILYRERLRGEPSSLPSLALQYADYARWQRALVPTLAKERAFWAKQLAGLPRLELPTSHPRTRDVGARGATVSFHLPLEVVKGLQALGRREGCTLYVTLLAGYAALLHRYTGQVDFGIGTVTAARERTAVRDLIGFVANTVVVRADLSATPTFVELLRRVRERSREALAHAALPFEEVVSSVATTRGGDQNPLFQTSFMLESLPALDSTVPGMQWRPVLHAPDGAVEGTSKFDLSLALAEVPEGLVGALEYRSDLFEEQAMRRLAGHLEVLLRSAVEDPTRRVGELSLLTAAERRELLETWSGAEGAPSQEDTVHAQFAAQAARTPGAVAVVFEDEALTYAELRARVGMLATRLRALGVGPEVRVGVSVERSTDMVVALLGVLEAGGAYVPLDPGYPRERLLYMLEDSGARVLVTQSHLSGALALAGVEEVRVDTLEAKATAQPLPPVGAPSNVCYVIYTSGSTGKPKGVMVPHETVTRFFGAMDPQLGGTPAGSWLAVTSYSFDISVLELLWTLTRGFKVVISGEESSLRARRPRAASARPLDFSLFYFADDSDQPGDRYRLLMEGARFADRQGFKAVWTPERHFHAFGGLYPNPSVAGAAIAAITERVGIRAGSVVLPLHHPVRVAEEWSLVDNLSRGRVGISVASGWHADDFVLAPERYARRKEAMMEGLEIVRRLWRGEEISLPGGDGKPVKIRLRPRPVQPHLPVWLTAAGNPETFRAAAAAGAYVLTHLLGQGLEELKEKISLYRETWRASGHPGEGHVTLMLHTYVDPDIEQVKARVEGPFKAYLRSSLDLMKGIGRSLGMDVEAPSLSPDDQERIVAHAFRRYYETSGLFGTPRSSREMVERVRDLGVDEVGCLIDFGIDTDAVLRSLPALGQLQQLSEREQRRAGEPATLPALIRRHQVTHLQCTPSLARAITMDPEAAAALSGLHRLMVGGEAFPPPLASELSQAVPQGLMNMYGPTETTIWSSTHPVRTVEGTVPIGTPIAQTRLYVLDPHLQLVPVGVAGELYIAGGGVVRGYHNQPGLTAERFLPDPFSAEPGARMYRTGDLARWRPDGTVEFLGRADHQLKVRGFRIEAGEVEAAIARYSGVREAVVVAREDTPGDVRLVAYVVASAEPVPDSAVLRTFVAQSLPEYMVPSVFVFLEKLPLTPNGKVDRKALPAPSAARRDSAAAYVPPRGKLEEQIAAIWQEVLKVEKIGVNDNFFHLGGHSLLMVQVHHRLRVLRPDLQLVKLLEYPTISAIAAYLSEAPKENTAVVSAQDRARRQLESLKRQRPSPRKGKDQP